MPRNLRAAEGVARDWRNKLLSDTDWLVTRHRDEKDEGTGTTLTAKQFKELLRYRKALRDWDKVSAFPAPPQLP